MKWLFACILLSMVLSSCLESKEDRKQIELRAEKAKQICDPIVDAIISYQAERGEYPIYLKDLVPQYIDSIPSCVVKTNFSTQGCSGMDKIYYTKIDSSNYNAHKGESIKPIDFKFEFTLYGKSANRFLRTSQLKDWKQSKYY